MDAVSAWPRASRTVVTDEGEHDSVPPLLLLHAWAGSRRSFAPLQPLLARHARAVAVDLRGHGDADKPPSGLRAAGPSRRTSWRVLDALDLPRAVLVGVSSGGYLAQQVAVSAPDRVAGLVLAGAPHDLRGRPPFADELATITRPGGPGLGAAVPRRVHRPRAAAVLVRRRPGRGRRPAARVDLDGRASAG